MFCETSTMIKCSCRCYCSHNQGRLASHNQSQNWSKIKNKKYINLHDHQNSAIETVADTSKQQCKSHSMWNRPNFRKVPTWHSWILLKFCQVKAAVSWKFSQCSACTPLKILWIITHEH